jgi:hypothetical protein
MADELAVRGFETTTMAEVTPRWLSRLPAYNPRNVTVLSGDAEVQSPGRIPFRWASRVKANAASTLEMSIRLVPGLGSAGRWADSVRRPGNAYGAAHARSSAR